jgi:hypothetical protein
MPKKQRNFADDGWAIWVDGEDTSTVYINDWLNPKGKSFVDIAIRVRGVKASKGLHVYVPFPVSADEIQDMISFIPGIPEGKVSTIITAKSGTSSITIFYCEDKSTAETIEEALDEIDDVYGLQDMELGRKAKRVWFGHEAAIDAAK